MRRGVSFKDKIKDKLSKDTKRTYYKAYFIREYDSNNDFINEEPESEDEEDEVIIIIILKKVLRKISKHKWLADISAISHIINNPSIYKSPLEPYYRVI